jgi:hypothetical protein
MFTQHKDHSKDFATNPAKHLAPSIIYGIHFWVVELESTNHVVRPSCHTADRYEAKDAGDKAENMKRSGDSEDTETDLGFGHEGDGTYP